MVEIDAVYWRVKKIHTIYMRDPLKIKSQNLPYKKTDLYGRIWRGFPGPCREMVLVERYKLICENVCMVSAVIKKRESHFVFCTPHPCPEWGVSLYFEKCLPAFCVVGGIDCVRDSKVGTP